MFWSARERNLTLDNRPVKKLGDYLGTLRTVVFCTEDMQLIKGTGRTRRRFLDLLLSQTQPGYLALLQRYMQCRRAGNTVFNWSSPDTPSRAGSAYEPPRLGGRMIRLARSL